MPRYQVIAPGFHGGQMYSPEGKRKVVHTDKPYPSKNKKEQVPSWLKRVKDETAEEKEQRLLVEKYADQQDSEKSDDDQKAIKEASFMGEGESSSVVETI